MVKIITLLGLCCLFLLGTLGALTAGAQDARPMLRYGEPTDGALAGGASVEFQFQAEAGDPLIIVANAKGGEIDPFLQLFTPEGALMGEDDDGGGKRNARLEDIDASTAGIYTVRLTNGMSGGSGNYALIVNNAAQVIAYHGGGVDSPFSADPGYVGYQLSEPWHKTDLTYTIVNVIAGFPDGAVEQVIAESLQAWSNNTPLTFTRVSDQNADIIIQFTQIDGSSQVLGQACPPSSPCAGSVEFDVDENWTLYEPQAYDDISFLGVATHEFGHIVGLLHSSDTSALMYPQYSPYNLQPSTDDIAGVQRLYGAGTGGVIGAPTPAPGGGGQGEGNEVVSTISDSQYVEFWDFDVTAGEYVTITMEALNGGLDPLLVIIDANDSVIAYDDDSLGNLNAVVRNIRFPQSGTYTAAATRFEQVQGYTEGQYRLTLDFGFTDAPASGGSAANTPAPQGGGSVSANKGTVEDFNSLTNLDTFITPGFVDSLSPITQSSTGEVRAGETLTWSLTWCATESAAARASAAINVAFAIEGQPVPADTVTRIERRVENLSCTDYFVVLSGWSGSSVRLTATMTLSAPVFDGMSIYQPGDYVYEYALTITP